MNRTTAIKPTTKLLMLIPTLFVLRVIEQTVPDARDRNALVIGALLVALLVAVVGMRHFARWLAQRSAAHHAVQAHLLRSAPQPTNHTTVKAVKMGKVPR